MTRNMYVCMYVYMHACMHAYMYMHACVYVYVLYMYMHACIYVYVYVYDKFVYRQSQVRMPNGSGVKWAECLLIIGTSCRVQVF